MKAIDYFRGHRLAFAVAVAVAVLIGTVTLWKVINTFSPLPPRTVIMVTGGQGGAYHKYGERYRAILARAGIDLLLVPTAGALDNLQRLNDPTTGVSVGFVQGGTTGAKASPQLESLGTVFYEPLWFFCRSGLRGKGMEGLRSGRIAVGQEGSGTRALVLELLAKNGLDRGFAQFLPLSFQESSEQLLKGEIDALFVLAAWDSPVVQRLLASERVELMNFPLADAYAALYPFLHKLVIPAGVGDMVRVLPAENTELLAPKASLVVRSDLHPAIQYLLLAAAEEVHSSPGLFNKSGQFPAAESTELPLSEEARRFYKSGQPFLQRYLPFWLAVLLGRLLVMLIPVVGILLPLMRIVPALFNWKMQRRIHKLYYELRTIEHVWESRGERDVAAELATQLDRLEEKADKLWLPVSSMGSFYLFKEHVSLVRKRMVEAT